MARSKEVDAWFARYDNPMKDVVQRVREIVLAADKRIGECIKWQAPTFTFQGNLASFFPKAKAHASLMFHQGAKIPGNHPLLQGAGETSRMLKLASVAEANAAKQDLVKLVKAWCEWKGPSSSKQVGAKQQVKAAGKQAVAKQAVAKQAVAKQTVAKQAVAKQPAQAVGKQATSKASPKPSAAQKRLAQKAGAKRVPTKQPSASKAAPPAKQPAQRPARKPAPPKPAAGKRALQKSGASSKRSGQSAS